MEIYKYKSMKLNTVDTERFSRYEITFISSYPFANGTVSCPTQINLFTSGGKQILTLYAKSRPSMSQKI